MKNEKSKKVMASLLVCLAVFIVFHILRMFFIPMQNEKSNQETKHDLTLEVNESEDTQTEKIQEVMGQLLNKEMQTEPPRIAITFDDGPSACTPPLLDGLKERNVKATFFLVGENVEVYPEIVKRIHEEGHLIGNHTYHHVEITKLSDEEAMYEINKTDEVIAGITG